ncbi:unnamed protein product [Alternaria alternata]
MDALKPLKAATKRLEGRGNSGRFGCIAEVILVFEYILNYYESRVLAYEAVKYNAHDEAPKDHLAINMRAAWAKASDQPAVRRLKVLSNDIDDAIDSIIDPTTASNSDEAADDEYTQWKLCERRVEKGSEYANNPIKYWLLMRDRYPQLSKLALDSLADEVYNHDFWRQYSAYDGGVQLV